MPLVTVLMPVYNAAAHLDRALRSVLSQSLKDMELLAIDDGSTDGSAGILASVRDPRLKVLRHRRNKGLEATLNEGIGLARGRYVARMDSDDVCLPGRLSAQWRWMESHPETDVLGGAMLGFGQGAPTWYAYPAAHADILAAMVF